MARSTAALDKAAAATRRTSPLGPRMPVGAGHGTAGTPERDGRRRRGGVSRQVILDAAVGLIASGGVAAVSHRSVARAAGVPLARVSYHFPRIDDLLSDAAGHYLSAFDDRLRASAAAALDGGRSVIDACTDVLAELLLDGPEEFLAMLEVRLALRRLGRSVEDPAVLEVISSFGVAEAQAVAVASAMFGFAVVVATTGEPVDRERIRSHVRTVLTPIIEEFER